MRQLAAFVALCVLSAVAQAAPASDESIDRLLQVTRAESLTETMIASLEPLMRQSMAAALQGEKITPQLQSVLDALPARFAAVMRDELSWSKMKPDYVAIYQDTFSQEEIDGLIAFYASPAGQAFVDKMPVVMQKSMALTQARMRPLVERMKAAAQQAIEDAKRPRP